MLRCIMEQKQQWEGWWTLKLQKIDNCVAAPQITIGIDTPSEQLISKIISVAILLNLCQANLWEVAWSQPMSSPFKLRKSTICLCYTSIVTFPTILWKHCIHMRHTGLFALFHCANKNTEEDDLYFNWSVQLGGGHCKINCKWVTREVGTVFALGEINDDNLHYCDEHL